MKTTIDLSEANIISELKRLKNARREIREEEAIRKAARRARTRETIKIRKYLPTLLDWLQRIEDSSCTPAS